VLTAPPYLQFQLSAGRYFCMVLFCTISFSVILMDVAMLYCYNMGGYPRDEVPRIPQGVDAKQSISATEGEGRGSTSRS